MSYKYITSTLLKYSKSKISFLFLLTKILQEKKNKTGKHDTTLLTPDRVSGKYAVVSISVIKQLRTTH